VSAGTAPDYVRLHDEENADFSVYLHMLTSEQWEMPSLCDGWRVRDVVGHIQGAAQAVDAAGPARAPPGHPTGARASPPVARGARRARPRRGTDTRHGVQGQAAGGAGLRLEATDIDWSHGAAGDPVVRGPGEAILMAVLGRGQATADLEGEGVPVLAGRTTGTTGLTT